MRLRRHTWIVSSLAATAFLVCGCGGGGGGDGGGESRNELFAGSYQYAGLSQFLSSDEVRATVGVVDSDGAGTLTFGSVWAAQEGASVGPLVPDPIGYGVDASRAFTVPDPDGILMRGRVAADGSVAALTSRQGGQDLRWVLYIRRNTSPSVASLAGTWQFMEWNRTDVGTYLYRSTLGTATVSATGAVNVSTTLANYSGEIDPVLVFPANQQIEVRPDGSLAFHQPPAGDVWLRGGVSDDGNVILLGGELSMNHHARVRVMVRESSGQSQAMLSGSYAACGLQAKAASGVVCFFGPCAFDGSGGASWAQRIHVGEVVQDQSTFPLTYTVASDGSSFLGYDLGTTFQGMVLGGGTWVLYGGGTSDSSPTALQAFIR